MPGANRTVDEYLRSLPVEQQDVIGTIRDLILRNLPKGYQESMTWGVPTYEVPLERYPNTYNGKPLGYAALAAKKNYYTIHLVSVYANPRLREWLESAFERRGKKLDMGKGCLRFKRLDDLPLDVIAEVISKTTAEEYIARIEAGQQRSARPSAEKSVRGPKAAAKASARRPSRSPARTKTAKKRARTR